MPNFSTSLQVDDRLRLKTAATSNTIHLRSSRSPPSPCPGRRIQRQTALYPFRKIPRLRRSNNLTARSSLLRHNNPTQQGSSDKTALRFSNTAATNPLGSEFKMIHQAIVSTWGEAPKYVEAPSLPAPGPDEVQIKVHAVAIHPVVRMRATGKHYSTQELPHIPGVDGVGETVPNGKLVYYTTFQQGTMATHLNLPRSAVVEIPCANGALSLDDQIQIASAVNPTASSFLAFHARVSDLPKGFTCVVLGATSASGRIAVTLARERGAGKVVGVARNEIALAAVEGLDEYIVSNAREPGKTDFSSLVKDGVDLILDFVYGSLTHKLLSTLPTPRPLQYVEIGQLSGEPLPIEGGVLRSKDITMRGAGMGSWSLRQMGEAMPELVRIVAQGKLPRQATRTAALADIERVWDEEGDERVVFLT
ncbi:hypothetical protein MRB53_038074 [Persea americana]|nr:hypothetical protein MRB53_038074 [Persea americana]